MKLSCSGRLVLGATTVLLVLVLPAAAKTIEPTPANIDAAIFRAKQYLYSKQHEGGRWEKDATREGNSHTLFTRMQGDTYGGYTALSTYALLASGENPNEPRIKAAVEFLKHADIVGIYAIAMRCQVWLLIPHDTPEMRSLIQKDADALFRGLNDGHVNPKNRGMWDYLGQGPRLDHSVSQYGVLGLWACEQTGAIEVGAERWRMIEAAWRDQQATDGGWDYGEMTGSTPSMTIAGVASLFIIGDYLHSEEGIGCLGNGVDPWIDKGIAWINKHYDNIGPNGYAMYGIERIGAASGYKHFSDHDWYIDLGRRLINSQADDGSLYCFEYPGSAPLDCTCFGLLFLSRGRAPVMLNKLDYHELAVAQGTVPEPANWNERPRDVANLTSFCGRQAETFLQWQIVNFQAAPEDLHDAPVLYLSGNLELKLSVEQAEKLKTFVEEGGTILANADCGRDTFCKTFEGLGRALFGRKFRDLPADHPIYTHEQFPAASWRKRPRLRGLSNRVRELMVLIPDADPARYWQDPRALKPHADMFELGADVYQYAVDRQLWNKGDSYFIRTDPGVVTSRTIKVARLSVGQNWDPEPGGWRRLASLLHNEDHIQLDVFSARPGQGELTAARIAHLTGTGDFQLDDPAALEIKTFVQNGGTLVIDAAGGSSAFAAAAERELRKLFGEAARAALANPLARDHAVYRLEGHVIDTFTYRAWARLHSVGGLKEPRVCGIQLGNRIGVYFSREDLSAALVGEPVDGITGYSPQTGTAIMRNILLYNSPETEGK
jgi:hypothetical protein